MDGVADVLDAYRPHLGAHRGVGGKVVGETLQCPFHGWRFDGSGRCVKAAQSEYPPQLGESDGWPVIQRNAVILVRYHPERKLPAWEARSCQIPLRRADTVVAVVGVAHRDVLPGGPRERDEPGPFSPSCTSSKPA